MEFGPEGDLQLRVDVAEEDILYDEIGSGLKQTTAAGAGGAV